MAPFNPIIASLNFTHAPSFSLGLRQFIVDRSLIMAFFEEYAAKVIAWLSQPQVYACIIAWAIAFTAVLIVILGLGFGPGGVVAGSSAAAFQAWMYGGFTPAAGVFATLTSLGMVGYFNPLAMAIAACIATAVAGIVWICGVGA